MLSPELQTLVATTRAHKQSLVLVTGVFDVLHRMHQQFLGDAKAAGDILVVGIESDVRVKQLKGRDRPYYNQQQRQQQLQDLHLADVVFVLPENFDDPAAREELIKELRPTVLAVSAHSPHQPAKQALVEKYGGRLKIVTPHDPRFSTTKLLNQHKSLDENLD